MNEDQKRDFARRLNDAIDESPFGIPAKGDGRSSAVGKLFGVSQRAAWKWLAGEGYPQLGRAISIAKRLKISVEWLLTGQGDKHVISDSNIELAHLLEIWHKMPETVQDQFLRLGEALIMPTQPAPPTQPEQKQKSRLN